MATKAPTPEDAVTARRILLDGAGRDAQALESPGELEPLPPRNDTFLVRSSSASLLMR
jgi:hypothetical protein